jgi:hypothetical protein
MSAVDTQRGIEDYRAGLDPFPNVTFFQLKTIEERERWNGWFWAKDREKILKSQGLCVEAPHAGDLRSEVDGVRPKDGETR